MNGFAPQISGEWASTFDGPPVQDVPAPMAFAPRPVPRLSIVLPFIGKEIPRVLALLGYMAQLSGRLNRTLYLLPFKGLDVDDVARAARKAFADVQLIRDNEGVTSDWQKNEKTRDAAGPNSLFRQAVWFFYTRRDLGPWLWLEPDCVPLVDNWDDEFEAAYRAAGKPFFGAPLKWPGGEQYLNGAAIYPRDVATLAPTLAQRTMWGGNQELEVGFDVAGGADVVRQACFSDLIQLEYRSDNPGPLRPDAVLFHGDRSGVLLNNLSGGVVGDTRRTGVPDAQPEREPARIRSAQKTSKAKTQGGRKVSRRAHTPKIEGSTPSPATFTDGMGSSQVASPGSAGGDWQDVSLHTQSVGDQIRAAVDVLANLATNSNRKTRILSELRKRKLVRK